MIPNLPSFAATFLILVLADTLGAIEIAIDLARLVHGWVPFLKIPNLQPNRRERHVVHIAQYHDFALISKIHGFGVNALANEHHACRTVYANRGLSCCDCKGT